MIWTWTLTWWCFTLTYKWSKVPHWIWVDSFTIWHNSLLSKSLKKDDYQQVNKVSCNKFTYRQPLTQSLGHMQPRFLLNINNKEWSKWKKNSINCLKVSLFIYSWAIFHLYTPRLCQFKKIHFVARCITNFIHKTLNRLEVFA